jgi:hypothetical protein
MPVASSNITVVQQQALTSLVAGSRVVNLLSPVGAVGAAVGDILAAAGSVVNFVNTANAALTTLVTPINDPIGTSFSAGQPYGGTFITSPTVTQLTPVNFSQSLNTSTQSLSQLSPAQQIALSAQTGVMLLTDADLAVAMATVFSLTQANFKLAFSINLAASTTVITPPVFTSITTAPTVAIAPLTATPNMTALSAFVAQVSSAFPNITGIEGVAASVWVDGLGVTVGSTGAAIVGVPADISSGSYNDITTAASGLIPGLIPVTVVDYSYQQNQFNLVTALAIDHGLSATLTALMATSMVTDATLQVIKNRLNSVAQLGDAAMLDTMFTILGANNIPNAPALLTNLLVNLNPSDQATTSVAPTITASGITLDTATPSLSTSSLLTYINSMLSLVGTTIQTLCTQNTCNSIFCSQSLLNIPMIKKINLALITSLLGQSTVQLAYMF